MNAYEERQEARKNYYEEMAAKKRQESSALYNSAHEMASVIPFGQPIASNSNRQRDINYRGKIDGTFRRSFEAQNTAEYYKQKAASVGTGGISSDDPDAIEKLQEKLAGLEQSQEMMKAANKLIKKNDVPGIVALGFTEEQAKKLFEGNHFGQPGFPSYRLTNNNAEIRRLKDRIESLQKAAEREPVRQEYEGFSVSEEENRIQFIFGGKPSEEIRNVLKRHAFKWSPTRGAWVRMATGNGRYAMKWAIEELAKLNGGN